MPFTLRELNIMYPGFSLAAFNRLSIEEKMRFGQEWYNRVFNLHNRLLEYKKLSADLDALDAKRAWHGEDYKNKIFHGAHLLNLLFLAANSCSIDGNSMDSKYRKKIEQLQQQREQCNRQSFHYGGADVWIAARCVRQLLHGYKNIGIELEKDVPDLNLLPPARNIAALNIALGLSLIHI